ncbi:MAG: actin-binding WH2 domain-containing protein [Anaerolineae bacterium]|nr:actin-binding WH2 domain-containing protein [Anaerolineae bacterium]
MNDLLTIEALLRDRPQFLAELGQGIELGPKLRAMLRGSIGLLLLYGALLGATHSLGQTVSSALKLPLLFLATLLICAPVLYLINALFGAGQSLTQSLALVLTAITVTALLLLSFMPVTIFFITVTDHYQFFKLLNVGLFLIAGGGGAIFLKQGMAAAGQPQQSARLIFYLWLAVYIFVGCQMAWTLRPFFGYPGTPFELIRQFGGNFYSDVFRSVSEIFGFLIVR